MSGACPPLECLDPSLREGVEVARDLGVDPATGLSAAQAARRLDTDGPNELESEPPVPLWRNRAVGCRRGGGVVRAVVRGGLQIRSARDRS
ncbi:cation-transporting P-type ATPase [Mycolicibacterium sp. BiH015]|nr:cation-transporting P-type ATPase [Mycolicibacterium sp. BiH015]MDA2891226.1 cation-transporting P-type ATPase [Mycolicibacterium sp. BiH015]